MVVKAYMHGERKREKGKKEHTELALGILNISKFSAKRS